jgi:hypothetical protein
VRRLAKGAIAGAALTVLGVALSSAPMLATASCDGHECDPSVMDWGCPSADGGTDDSLCTQGEMIQNGTVWESTPISANWLDFEGFRTFRLHTECWTGNRVPEDLPTAEIAFFPSDGTLNPFPANDPPDAPVSAATTGSGNDYAVSHWGAGLVEVENSTCAAYLVRVTIPFGPAPDGGPTPPCVKKQAGGKATSHPDGG